MKTIEQEKQEIMDITILTVKELKALAYDQLKLLIQAQNELNSIENELSKRFRTQEAAKQEKLGPLHI